MNHTYNRRRITLVSSYGIEKTKSPINECLKKSKPTRVRVELTILRLTVARLNQLGHPVKL